LNPRNTQQKVASGTVSGINEKQKFHFMDIPVGWIKVGVRVALVPNV
jgi:hypothetical protein